jgi:hypothetical protein
VTGNQYWFTEDAKTVSSTLTGMHGQWSIWGMNPISQAWIRNNIMYYSTVLDPQSWESALSFQGQQGELVKMAVPQARSLIRQLITLLTRQKMAFKAMAERVGADISRDLKLGDALATEIVDTQGLELKRECLVEQAMIHGMSFMKASWRTDKGEFYVVDPDDDAIMTNGDLEISNHSVFDVFYDFSIEHWRDLDWVEVRTLKNKWTLAAQIPELREQIIAMSPAKAYRGFYQGNYANSASDDMVYVYEAYHKPTPALPSGRMVVYGGEDVILYDGPNPYGRIPVFSMKPETIHGLGMGFGYPFFSNLLPAQEMLDHSFSAIATNQGAFAVQNILVPRGADISAQELGGMNFISYTPQTNLGGGKPEPLQLTQSSPETFKFIDVLLAHMQQISNVNSALRGDPPPGVTSGAAIATLTTNAIEFVNSAARSAQTCMQEVVSCGIDVYRIFAKIDRVLNIKGKNGLFSPKKFNAQDLFHIKGVRITEVNPIMQTLSGRMDLAEKLISNGMVSNTREFLSILDGEPIDRLTDVETSENDLIQSENDDLMEGNPVMILATDDHPTHIREHHMLLNDPERRRNSKHVSLILDHIMKHFEMLKGPNAIDPTLMAVIRTGKIPEGALQEAQQMEMGDAPTPPGEPAQGSAMPAEPAEDMLGRESM